MVESQRNLTTVEVVKATLEENGFIELSKGIQNLPGIVQEIINNPKYGLLFGTKRVLNRANRSSTQGVIVLYDQERVKAMRFDARKKHLSVREEERKDFYKRHIAALALSGYPVIRTPQGVVFLEPVEQQVELQSA